MSKILITGGTGCIGAATVYNLLTNFGDSIEQILIVTRNNSTDQLEIWFADSLTGWLDSKKIRLVSADLGDSQNLAMIMREFQPTHIIHLGALQSPACDADPEKGLEVNLAGTLKLFNESARLKKPLDRFVFASSAAVYGKRQSYSAATIGEDAQLAPPNLYGVWKVGGEHLAALFHQKTGVPTVSLRLNTTYGPGRDQGTTSAVTRIMKSLILGAHQRKTMPCLMPYDGRENYHYVEDVGAHFATACLRPFQGCCPFNIKGKTIAVSDFLETISIVADELGIRDYLETGISPTATPNLFICDLDHSSIELQFPDLPRTEIIDGIRKTLKRFQTLAPTGKIRI